MQRHSCPNDRRLIWRVPDLATRSPRGLAELEQAVGRGNAAGSTRVAGRRGALGAMGPGSSKGPSCERAQGAQGLLVLP